MEFISLLIKHHAGPTGDVLICKNAEGVWEFPHDKIRTNESYEEAVARVAWEQVGICADPGIRLMIGRNLKQDGTVEHLYEGNITHNTHTKDNYHNYFEAVNKWQYEPKSDKYTEFKWVHASELGEYEFAGDDKNFMAKYDPYINARFIPDVRMY